MQEGQFGPRRAIRLLKRKISQREEWLTDSKTAAPLCALSAQISATAAVRASAVCGQQFAC